MCDFAVMRVEEIWCLVVGFERRQVFRSQMRVRLFSGKDREQKREVGVVRVQQIQLAQVEGVVARWRSTR